MNGVGRGSPKTAATPLVAIVYGRSVSRSSKELLVVQVGRVLVGGQSTSETRLVHFRVGSSCRGERWPAQTNLSLNSF